MGALRRMFNRVTGRIEKGAQLFHRQQAESKEPIELIKEQQRSKASGGTGSNVGKIAIEAEKPPEIKEEFDYRPKRKKIKHKYIFGNLNCKRRAKREHKNKIGKQSRKTNRIYLLSHARMG
jgi:hypothetical protein